MSLKYKFFQVTRDGFVGIGRTGVVDVDELANVSDLEARDELVRLRSANPAGTGRELLLFQRSTCSGETHRARTAEQAPRGLARPTLTDLVKRQAMR